MEKNLTVWTLLLCLIIGLALLLFNVISWTTYFVVVSIIAGLTFFEKKRRSNPNK
ncbi:hypothetical protein QJ527_04795 [Enterococcus mundtii]|uniref:hypothetical protein n=1 Tax=Enterococcus mundtii TaxID=53346 RepID=UPI000AC35EFD|nr:hypothetical protein [Enterococcus mundtii]MDA9428454.1 hypothetical protein [Enterococcus mundtii 1A]MDK4210862.1 hypothetical protein [Enterococcus mundtii]MDO7877884.1 hypothetical protein [Enterococcus mundtii]